jgi:hypothetical protein
MITFRKIEAVSLFVSEALNIRQKILGRKHEVLIQVGILQFRKVLWSGVTGGRGQI